MRKNKGFTLIELLVVIAIIGLLSTMAVVALNSARAKSRDARRVSDIKQIQTALEMYYQDANGYPTFAGAATIMMGAMTFSGNTYLAQMPSNPSPNGAGYSYTSANGSGYTITFNLESGTGALSAGNHSAFPGIVQ